MSIIWRKVWRDLWGNKTRTFLIVLATAVGVFALSSAITTDSTVGTLTIPLYIQGLPTSSELLLVFVPVDAGQFRIPAGATGSKFEGQVNATASTTYSLKKNGSQFGTAQVGAGVSSGTFTVASATTFDPSVPDIFTIVAPASPDATHADFTIHLQAELL